MLDGCVGWPPDFVDRYRGAGYWQPRTLGELARHEARHNGDRLALAGSNCRLTYRALDAAADRVAAGLYRLGIGPRDRVVIQLPNVPQFVVVALALFRLGAVPVFVLPAHRRNEIQFLCSHTEAVAYVVPDALQRFDYRVLAREMLSSVSTLRHVIVVGDAGEFVPFDAIDAEPHAFASRDPGDVAFLLLSGSTAARPRLIPRTHHGPPAAGVRHRPSAASAVRQSIGQGACGRDRPVAAGRRRGRARSRLRHHRPWLTCLSSRHALRSTRRLARQPCARRRARAKPTTSFASLEADGRCGRWHACGAPAFPRLPFSAGGRRTVTLGSFVRRTPLVGSTRYDLSPVAVGVRHELEQRWAAALGASPAAHHMQFRSRDIRAAVSAAFDTTGDPPSEWAGSGRIVIERKPPDA